MTEKECGEVATWKYIWIGKDEVRACLTHTVEAMTLADAMGFPIYQLAPLTPAEISEAQLCSIKVDDE